MLARLMLSLILGLSEYDFEINFIAQLEIKTCTTFNLVNFHLPVLLPDCSIRRQRICGFCYMQGCSVKGYRGHQSEQVQ